ncbi:MULTISPECIES: TetR/AcrR family transcriptional regulator [Serratia]|uniref:TetR/AcrR family transcriptional regulator n=1 Tax=Serratia TaxID=613 RepID=UPI000665B813|nr:MULTISPECIES: TetR/AcrR family transcriptional regulator [Serratia]MBL0903436.1 TetR/AcrR family transcriptional regulator [Serratia bockelmannii]ASL82577.1 TetR family transcriptional regulator [Serratia marcescens]MBH2533929.1 TetR/AcrR family transcriptional regulator [Serratia marcescens]MBH2765973.1 TetR/AcrR family transcriptional regulator [Serratia marcescens]MBH2824241.1 TetR/AcrR family transcriptional regulator [Serratia marcescens]
MARPRSEEKQQALLRAATDIFAEQGLAAPTSAIARKAGVSEGTLFRYFENKDVLLSAVCDYLLDEMECLLTQSLQGVLPGKDQMQVAWNAYIDWALANPAAYATGNKLMVSGKLSSAQMERSVRFGDISQLGIPLVQGLDLPLSSEFQGMICTVMANGVIDMAVQKPHLLDIYKRAGYEAMVRAIELPDVHTAI